MLIAKKGRTACCDCGLVHDEEYRVTKRGLMFKAVRNRRATAQLRRHMKATPPQKREGINDRSQA